MGVKILGTGSYVPDKVITNYDLEKKVDTSHEWILERTGISERRIAENIEASDMAVFAANMALKMSHTSKDEIDLIIVATISGDMVFPSTACIIQQKMQIKNAFAFDISAACSGFVYAIDIVNQYFANPRFKKALIIGTEKMSPFIDWEDRNTCILFGDGAGAVVVENQASARGVIISEIGSGLDAVDLLKIPGGGSHIPISKQCIDDKMHYVKMQGKEVFKKAVNVMTSLCVQLMEKSGLSAKDIKLMIPHQANIRIIDAMAKKMGLSKEKVFINISKYGNSSAASIPVALDEANRNGLIHEKDNIVLVAFGAGFTWGGMILEW